MAFTHKQRQGPHQIARVGQAVKRPTPQQYQELSQPMNENVDIFISTYKDFKTKPTNPVYKIISGGEEEITNTSLPIFIDDSGLNNHAYNEYSRLYWIWKNYPLKEYIGLNHYRKYYDFFENVPDIEKVFETHDIILANKIRISGGLRKQYSYCHNVEDFDCVMGILKEKYPEYTELVDNCDRIKEIDACSMFIMKRDDFIKYCEWIFDILEEFDKKRGLTDEESYTQYVTQNKDKYLKRSGPNKLIDYQTRIDGYLAERLFTIYVKKNFTNPQYYRRKITESKYLLGKR